MLALKNAIVSPKCHFKTPLFSLNRHPTVKCNNISIQSAQSAYCHHSSWNCTHFRLADCKETINSARVWSRIQNLNRWINWRLYTYIYTYRERPFHVNCPSSNEGEKVWELMDLVFVFSQGYHVILLKGKLRLRQVFLRVHKMLFAKTKMQL